MLLGVAFGLLTVDIIEALGLDQLVNLEANGSSEQFLGHAVVDRSSIFALLLLPQAHALKGGS